MTPAATWLRTLIALAACTLAMTHVQAIAQEFMLDPERTTVSFEVRSLGIFTERGRFAGALGTGMLDPASSAGTLTVVIDARTVEASSAATREFLLGRGMLNAEVFPEITYEAQRVLFDDDQPVRIDGELTLLGVTRPVSLEIAAYGCVRTATLARCLLDARTTFKRSEFGMNRYLTVASDEVKLAIRTELEQRPRRATEVPAVRSL
jgi:polyisoprenoid-binding protein YceI